MQAWRQRWIVSLFLVVVWVGIYLPHIGTPELRDDEAPTVLPAVAMIETGVRPAPGTGGEDALGNPPAASWFVAGALLATGRKSTAVARLPSAIFILAFVAYVVWMNGRWLDLGARFVASVVFLTSIGLIERGRLAGPEAVAISLTGLAVLSWLNGWAGRASRWSLWMVPSFFLGIGLLAQGPVVLGVYYGTVATVLFRERRLREMLTVEHAAGVALAGFIVFAWVIPARMGSSAGAMGPGWIDGILVHIFAPRFDTTAYALNIGRAFGGFLPWLLFVPLLWRPWSLARIEQDWQPLFKALRTALAIVLVPLLLIPGSAPNGAALAVPLASVLVGWTLSRHAGDLPGRDAWKCMILLAFPLACAGAVAGLVLLRRDLGPMMALAAAIGTSAAVYQVRHRLSEARPLAAATAALAVLVMLQYAVFVLPVLAGRGAMRPAGDAVNAAVPRGQTVHFVSPGISPLLFYIDRPIAVMGVRGVIPGNSRFVVAERRCIGRIRRQLETGGRAYRILPHLDDGLGGAYRLLEIVPATPRPGDPRRWVRGSCPGAESVVIVVGPQRSGPDAPGAQGGLPWNTGFWARRG